MDLLQATGSSFLKKIYFLVNRSHTLKAEQSFCSSVPPPFHLEGAMCLNTDQAGLHCWLASPCVEACRLVFVSHFPASFFPPWAGCVHWALPGPVRQTTRLSVLLLPPRSASCSGTSCSDGNGLCFTGQHGATNGMRREWGWGGAMCRGPGKEIYWKLGSVFRKI